jgi:hypothetical protein
MSARPSERTPATQEDIRSILGDLDDATTIEILGLSPSVSDLEEALMWSSGSGGDVLGTKGRPLTGIAAQVFDILARGEQEEEQ